MARGTYGRVVVGSPGGRIAYRFGKTIKLNVDFIDIGKQYSLLVENGVLNYANKFVDAPDATLTLTKDTLDNIQLKQITMDQATESGAIKIDGNKEAFTDFLGLLDTYPFWATS